MRRAEQLQKFRTDGNTVSPERLVVLLYERLDEGMRREFAAFMGKPREQRSATEVELVRAQLRSHGCIDEVRRIAQNLLGAAAHELEHYQGRLIEGRDRDFLHAIIPWIIEQGTR